MKGATGKHRFNWKMLSSTFSVTAWPSKCCRGSNLGLVEGYLFEKLRLTNQNVWLSNFICRLVPRSNGTAYRRSALTLGKADFASNQRARHGCAGSGVQKTHLSTIRATSSDAVCLLRVSEAR